MWLVQGEYGTALQWTVYRGATVENLTGMTTLQALFTSPSGVETARTLTGVNLAAGLVSYTPPDATIFNEAGVWRYYLQFTSASRRVITKPASLEVVGV